MKRSIAISDDPNHRSQREMTTAQLRGMFARIRGAGAIYGDFDRFGPEDLRVRELPDGSIQVGLCGTEWLDGRGHWESDRPAIQRNNRIGLKRSELEPEDYPQPRPRPVYEPQRPPVPPAPKPTLTDEEWERLGQHAKAKTLIEEVRRGGLWPDIWIEGWALEDRICVRVRYPKALLLVDVHASYDAAAIDVLSEINLWASNVAGEMLLRSMKSEAA